MLTGTLLSLVFLIQVNASGFRIHQVLDSGPYADGVANLYCSAFYFIE